MFNSFFYFNSQKVCQMSTKTKRKPLFIFHPRPPRSPVMLCNADRRMSPCWLLIGCLYAFVCVRVCRAREMWRACTCATVLGSIDRHLQAPLGCTEALIASIFPFPSGEPPTVDRTQLSLRAREPGPVCQIKRPLYQCHQTYPL